jgi:uncharacterized protein YjcR
MSIVSEADKKKQILTDQVRICIEKALLTQRRIDQALMFCELIASN